MTRLRLQQAADYAGVHAATLRRHADAGKIPHLRHAVSGQRTFLTEDLDLYMGKETPEHAAPRTVFYVRVSDQDRRRLNNQVEELTQAYGAPERVFKDFASGLNENRRGLKTLLTAAEQRSFDRVCLTHPDRLSRFGVSYLTRLLGVYGVTVTTLHDETGSPQEELMKDFMALVASFAGRFYRLRTPETKGRLLEEARGRL